MSDKLPAGFRIGEFSCWAEPDGRIEIHGFIERFLSPDQARDLAACLLAAADEAEEG